MQLAIAYLATLVVFSVVDTLWLGVLARPFYRAELGDLLAPEVKLWAAVLFYVVYSAGIAVFAVRPAIQADSLVTAVVMGALFGFFAYATYDLTNLATLRDWPLRMSLVDIAWGTFITSLTATAGTYAVRVLG
jgi:uncharacterized membrane protein